MSRHEYGPTPFLFPKAQSTILPNPSAFFSTRLLSSPLPTNSFFQNFVLKNGDQPEYIHPYLIKSLHSSLSICFPSRFATPSFIYQTFKADLTISSSSNSSNNHIISSFNNLSEALGLPPSLRFFPVSSNSSNNHIISSFNNLSVTLDLPPSLPPLLPRPRQPFRHLLHPRRARPDHHLHHPRHPLRHLQRFLHQAHLPSQQRPDLHLLLLVAALHHPIQRLAAHRPEFLRRHPDRVPSGPQL